MNPLKRTFAAVELLLIAPAVLFFTALFVRNLQPQQYEPAHTAQRIVSWYAARPHFALWLLLIALPAAVLVMGSASLFSRWRRDASLRQAARLTADMVGDHLATVLVAVATAASAAMLAIVALHVLTN